MTARGTGRRADASLPGHGMRPLKALLPLDEALRRCLEVTRPIERTERVPLPEARDRVVAVDVRAPRDVPQTERAAMDGYAVRAVDTRRATKTRPMTLECTAAIFAGDRPRGRVAAGTCVQIATGAAVPARADAVVMVEDTDRDRDRVRIYRPARRGQNISRRGSDLRARDPVVARGERLTPAKVGALAAIGRSTVRVYARPAVALLTTGDEVVPPGQRLRAGQVYDINSYTLAAVVREHGGRPILQGHVSDRLDRVEEALARALASDLVIVSGGSSVGTRDLLLDAFQAAGRVLFHGVAIRPGRPTLLALARDTPILGMPGNPTSCLNNAYVFVVPMLRRMARLAPPAERVVRAALASPLEGPPDKVAFVTVRLDSGRAIPVYKESGAITSMSRADGYVVVPAGGVRLEAGALVDVIRF